MVLLGDAAGRELHYVAVAPEQFAARLRAAGAGERSLTSQLGLFGIMRDGVSARVSDVVYRITGRAPRSLADYAAEHAAALRPAAE